MSLNHEARARAAAFWSDPAIVGHFATTPVADYWVEFFGGIADRKRRILDLGCGSGRNTAMLCELGFDVVACDLYPAMIGATHKRVPQAQAIQADMALLPLADSVFDVVLANGVYHNASSGDEFAAALAETARVMADAGFLCLNVFTAVTIAPELQPTRTSGLYVTAEGLDMLLLPTHTILETLRENRLVPHTPTVEYDRRVNTGVRSVLRGVFQKR